MNYTLSVTQISGAPDLKESVEEMGQTQRDQVVMVRVDESTRIDAEAFVAWGWLDEIDALLALPRNPPGARDGGDAVAEQVLAML